MSDVDHGDIVLDDLNGKATTPEDDTEREKEEGNTASPPDQPGTPPPVTPPASHPPVPGEDRHCPLCKNKIPRYSCRGGSVDVCEDGRCRSCENITSVPSLSDLLGEDVTGDDFQTEVAHKSQLLLIGRQEAELETIIDRLIRNHGTKEKALLYAITHFPTEAKVQIFVNTLLHRGANPSTCDSAWQTPLHHAVKRNFKGVCSKLLENEALPHVRDKDNNMPYHLALNNNNDDIAAMLLSVMPHTVVRSLFVATEDAGSAAECSLHDLINNNMQHAALGVLDAMMDRLGDSGHVRVFYHVLEVDAKGRSPSHPEFESHDKSCLHLISQRGLKSLVFHDVVRLLIRRKWKKYARLRFELNCLLFCVTLLCLTFSVAVSTLTSDPALYSDPLQIARGVAECFGAVLVLATLVLELNQMRRHRGDYWRDKFNWIDLSSSFLLLMVIPLRFTHRQEQWHVFSMGYLLWTLRMFKYAAVFRRTGAYALILWRIISRDILQFILFFLVILLAFTGSFTLALKGENALTVHNETSNYWNVMFVGVRTLIEAYAVVEYAGEGGYPPMSTFLMVTFLFFCCVVLLSILIAQLSDTYHYVQRDAQRGLELNRAWIISRVELNSIYVGKSSRFKTYIEMEEINNPRDILKRWDGPELSQMNKNIRDLWDHLDSNRMTLLTIQSRLARQENSLVLIQEYLEHLVNSESRDKLGTARKDRRT
ncbi:uncharacterized protein LOC124137315 [Haliotis rufescens]|uniref:uncharacterized protein LOC124137315 n=1 Tax=Haliotis rufescens TaxID=6454 RepID=UPI00201E7916|nr:uncharacterized protein LOC124137315 [Haliotis rufescens]XP_046359518.2 uncharacterized protein LOC124137315 [Haliotis rufescens]